ncbi:MAG: hypothetical protein HRF49_11105 [bacterium]
MAATVALFVRYRGWRAFNLGFEDDNGFFGSPWAEREFILSQYRQFQEHTEKINRIVRLKGHVDARERRHDTVLRDLVQTKQFGHAEAYLTAMISLCKELRDFDGEITYMTYLDRVRKFAEEEASGRSHSG